MKYQSKTIIAALATFLIIILGALTAQAQNNTKCVSTNNDTNTTQDSQSESCDASNTRKTNEKNNPAKNDPVNNNQANNSPTKNDPANNNQANNSPANNNQANNNPANNNPAKNSNKQVTICHYAPGNPVGNTITVGEDSVEAHISQHGDKLGSCPAPPPPTDTPPPPTDTPTSTPTDTPTSTPTDTPTSTPTDTPTSTPTDTPTDTPTSTPTDTPTSTPTDTPTSTPPSCQYPVNASDVTGLIEAINLANTDGIFSTICLSNSVYSIGTALPDLTSDIEIIGNGATITRSGAADYRILNMSSANITLNNLTISNGNVPTGLGGGIRIFGGSLTLDNVTASNNSANFGGGIAIDSAQFTSNNSTFSNNSANYSGGGLYFSGSNPTGTISNTTIISNTANKGAGIANDGGNLTIDFSLIETNSANEAGGIYNNFFGSMTISNTVFNLNQTTLTGAALFTDSYTVTVNFSCIVDNTGSSLDFKKTTGGTLNAENNWWGAADGPSGAATGSGDSVSTGIDYNPFETAPLAICS